MGVDRRIWPETSEEAPGENVHKRRGTLPTSVINHIPGRLPIYRIDLEQ